MSDSLFFCLRGLFYEANVTGAAAGGGGGGNAPFVGAAVEAGAYYLRSRVGRAFSDPCLAVPQKTRARFEKERWFFLYDGFSAIEA